MSGFNLSPRMMTDIGVENILGGKDKTVDNNVYYGGSYNNVDDNDDDLNKSRIIDSRDGEAFCETIQPSTHLSIIHPSTHPSIHLLNQQLIVKCYSQY